MKKPLIILDPGHGGIDAGAILKDKNQRILATEREENLLLSLTLKALLLSAGFDVILTRSTNALPGSDISPKITPPESFWYRCTSQPVTAFASLSIHHDTATAHGGGVYFDGNPKWPNPQSHALAIRISSEIHGWCRPDTAARQGSLAMCRQPHTLRRVLVELGPVRVYKDAADRLATARPVVDALMSAARSAGVLK